MANYIRPKIKVELYDNKLTPNDPNDLSPRVISARSLSVAEICSEAVLRGDSDVSADKMAHAVERFHKEMAYQLCNGFSVNTGWYTAIAHIRGVFHSPSEPFDPTRHTLSFDFQQGALMRKEVSSIEIEMAGLADSGVEITQVVDTKTGSVNDRLTTNRPLRITGQKLKIVGDHPDVGVYFLSANDNQYKVDPSDIIINNPAELLVMPPALAAGTYRVQVVTQYAVSSLLKAPRTFTFDKLLTVN